MQTSAIAARISTIAQSGKAKLNVATSQMVVNDWRLRGWTKTVSGGTWAAPTTSYTLVGSTSGDVIKRSGVAWDMGYQDLGTHTPVTLPDATTDTPYISSIALSASEDLICWYSNKIQNGYDAGVHVQRVVSDGAGHLYWSDPQEIGANVAIDDMNSQTQMFTTFPRLQTINNEYWILALEASRQANVITYHLCYSRGKLGTDGELHFSAFEYLAGVSNDLDEAGVGINGYLNSGVPTAFILADLKHAYLSISGNTTYIIGKNGNNFSCPSTSLVGITNASLLTDLTADNPKRNLSLPSAPTAGQGSYSIQNPDKKYNSVIAYPGGAIVPGSIVTHKAGYVTSNGSELVTLATEIVDEIRPSTAIDKNELTITTSDQAWLRDWYADSPFEYVSPKSMTYDLFCDLTSITEVTGVGNFQVDSNSNIVAKALDGNAPMPDYYAFLHEQRTKNGSLEFRWRITTSLTSHHVAAITQGTPDGLNFWAVIYNGDTQKFELTQAVADTNQFQYIRYNAATSVSGVVALVADTDYWMKVTQYHDHIIAWHSTDRITWTKEIDYSGITSNLGYWGIAGKSTGVLSPYIGNVDFTGGAQALDDGAGSPLVIALRVQTGAFASSLYALAALKGQTSIPSDLIIGLAADNGSGTAPADITNLANVLWQGKIQASVVGAATYPTWNPLGPSADVTLAASTYYWIFLTFLSALTGDQAYKWYSLDSANNTYGTGLTTTSSDAGATWAQLDNPGLDLCAAMFVMYDYGHAQFSSLYWTSGETPKTIEYLLADSAAKASVLSATVDSFVSLSDLVLGGDSILWQPVSFGTLGDFVFDSDVIVTGTTAEIIFRASAINGGATNGWRVVVDKANQLIKTYSPSATLIHSADTMQYIPATTFHVQLVCWKEFIYVYINRCLAATCYNNGLTTAGYFGLLSTGATWTNSRIPDMTPIKPYFIIDSEKSALNAITELVSKTRYQFYMNYDGSIRAGSFPRRTSTASYQATLKNAQGVISGRWSVNESIPQGQYYAVHYSGYDLDASGRRHLKKSDYTDAVTNEDAYIAAKLVLRNAEEKTQAYEFAMKPSDYSLQREDRITVTNSLDGHTADLIVNDLDFTLAANPADAQLKVGCRLFVT